MTNPLSFLPQGGATSVDPDRLEYLGKQAAALAEAGGGTLCDALVQTLGQEKLGAEQVRRVVECANTEAFNRKFSALDPSNRVVNIHGGPADPEQVLQTLNDCARPRSVELQSVDYDMPPEPKLAESVDFGLQMAHRTQAGVIQDILDLRMKVSAAHEETVHSAESAKFQMYETLQRLQQTVKTAVLDGLCREDLEQAWRTECLEMADIAAGYMPDVPQRGHKVAHRVNPDHPVVLRYREFVKTASRYCTFTAARQNLERRLIEVDRFLSERHS